MDWFRDAATAVRCTVWPSRIEQMIGAYLVVTMLRDQFGVRAIRDELKVSLPNALHAIFPAWSMSYVFWLYRETANARYGIEPVRRIMTYVGSAVGRVERSSPDMEGWDLIVTSLLPIFDGAVQLHQLAESSDGEFDIAVASALLVQEVNSPCFGRGSAIAIPYAEVLARAMSRVREVAMPEIEWSFVLLDAALAGR